MTSSMKRVYAIFLKDIKELTKNIFIATTLLVPLILAIFSGNSGEQSIETHYLVINLTFTAVAVFVQCTLIAEEKEKNTLRSLMLSPATISEILGGKSLLSFIFTVVTIIICAMITGYVPANLISIGIAIFISTLFYIALGTLLGLLTKSVMEASVTVMPIMFLFGFGTLLLELTDKYPALGFIEYLPKTQLFHMAKGVEDGVVITGILVHLAIITTWIIAMCILVVIVYKKRMVDK